MGAQEDIEQYKRNLLNAMAEGGRRSVDAYKQATDAANASQQSALDAERAAANQYGIGDAGYQQLAGIVNARTAPGLAAAKTQADHQAWYMGEMQGANERYLDRLGATAPGFEAQYDRELAEAMAGRGGGGRGGGGGGGDDWWDLLSDTYDTKSDLYNWIEMHGGEGRNPAFQQQRDIARFLGVPDAVLETRFQPSDFITKGLSKVNRMTARGRRLPAIRRTIRQNTDPLDRQRLAPDRRYLMDQARAAGAKPKKKKNRGR